MVLCNVKNRASLAHPLNKASLDVSHSRVLPVSALVSSRRVGRCELGPRLARAEADGQLRHGVHVLWQAANEGFDVGGQRGARVELGRQRVHLALGRDLAREQEPDEALRKGLTVLVAGERREQLLALRDGVATEPNALQKNGHTKMNGGLHESHYFYPQKWLLCNVGL